MRFIELTLLTGLLSTGQMGYGADVIKSEKTAVTATVDCKAVLEKFAQAYSALDDKVLTELSDKPETISATLKEMQEFKRAGVSPVLMITPLQTHTEKEIGVSLRGLTRMPLS